MAYWNSRRAAGQRLEEIINFTNESYRKKGLALFKTPRPLRRWRWTTNAAPLRWLLFRPERYQADYMGVVQGIPVALTPRKRRRSTRPSRISMSISCGLWRIFRRKGHCLCWCIFPHWGILFLPLETLQVYWEAAQKGGRKSIPYAAFEKNIRYSSRAAACFIIWAIARYLEETEPKGSDGTC